MEWLGYYLLFAVTTGAVAIYELLAPTIKSRQLKFPVDKKFLIYIVFLFISILIAPLVFLSCVVPSMGEKFRETLEVALFEVEEI